MLRVGPGDVARLIALKLDARPLNSLHTATDNLTLTYYQLHYKQT